MATSDLHIANFRHRVAICSMDDIAMADGFMSLVRKDVYHCWAFIQDYEGSTYSKAGYVVQEKVDDKSHLIFVRYRSDMNFSSAAWIYEARLKSSPRWFKILETQNWKEMGRYNCFSCKAVELSDLATTPQTQKPQMLGGPVMIESNL